MNTSIYYPPEKDEIKLLYKLIDVADDSIHSRVELLSRLGFISNERNYYEISTYIFYSLDKYLNLLIISAILLAIIALALGNQKIGFMISLFAILSTYLSWLRTQRNKNVDDSVKRKDKTNRMILENKKLLMPYTGKVFDPQAQFVEKHLSYEERVTIDMYIFTELDNLEFVFEKSQAHLIEDKYIIRAIKIFVARASNIGFFSAAKRLIRVGKYNERFIKATIKLLYVGHYYGDDVM